VKHPLLLLAVTSTLVVGALTGVSAAAFAAGSPQERTEVLASARLAVPADYVPKASASKPLPPTGFTVVAVASPISSEHESPSGEPSSPSESPAAVASQLPALPVGPVNVPLAPTPRRSTDSSEQTSAAPGSGSSKSDSDSSTSQGNGKWNQSENGNGKGKRNGGPAG
jgi:hypothetical protein